MSRWYYLKKGRAQGPVTTEELAQEIRNRTLGPFDLVYVEGDLKWKSLAEFSEFHSVLTEIQTPVVEDQWVLLQKKPEGKGFIQKGPHTTSEIRQMLSQGSVRYHDHVWKRGMKEWYKIANIAEFNRPEPQRIDFSDDEKPPLPDLSGETLLVNVMTLQREQATQVLEERPEESEGPDLAAPRSKIDRGKATKAVSSAIEESSPPPTTTGSESEARSVWTMAPSATSAGSTAASQSPTSSQQKTSDSKKKPEQPLSVFPPQEKTEVTSVTRSVVTEHSAVKEKTKPRSESPYHREKKAKQKKREVSVRKESWVDEFTQAGYRMRRAKYLRYAIHGLVIGSVVFVVAFVILLSSHRDQARLNMGGLKSSPEKSLQEESRPAVATPPSSPQTSGQAPAPAPAQTQAQTQAAPSAQGATPSTAQAPPPPAPRVEEKRTGTFLRLFPRQLSGAEPEIVVNTDASSHYWVKISIEGEAGKVLDHYSFFIEMSLKASEALKLNLKKLGLPAGQYVLKASIEKIEKEIQFFVGRNDKDFKNRLARHKKQISYYQQREKTDLLSLSSRLEGHLKRFSAKATNTKAKDWKKFYSSWQNDLGKIYHENLNKVHARSASKYIYPMLWMELADLKQKVNREARKVNQTGAITEEWRQVEKLVADFKNQTANLSLYKQ